MPRATADGRRAVHIAATAEELMRARYTSYTQVEMDFGQVDPGHDWPDMDQTVGESDDTWG